MYILLYKCTSNLEANYIYNNFQNDNENITDSTEVKELLVKLDEANSAAYFENIFDVDHFLTEITIEYLIGSWNNFKQR